RHSYSLTTTSTMEAVQGPPSFPSPKFEPDTDKIKRKLIQQGVHPTPKIVHLLRKKQIQKHNRKLNRLSKQSQTPPLSESEKQALEEETHFQTIKHEYKEFTKAIKAEARGSTGALMVGKPWERLERVGLREVASESTEYSGGKLKKEKLRELREMFEERRLDELQWVLDDDILIKEEWLDGENRVWDPAKRQRNEAEVIRFLVERLSAREITMRDWKFTRMMKQSGLQFTEKQLLKIVGGLGNKGQWKQALSAVEWVYNDKENKRYKSRFVYTKLLAVLGKARRPQEALRIFKLMRGDCHLYPDMAAYHSISVTLGQAGLVKELISIIECMRQKPSKKIKNARRNWDPILEPDEFDSFCRFVYTKLLAVLGKARRPQEALRIFKLMRGDCHLYPDMAAYHSISVTLGQAGLVLNACVLSHQWKGVSWVFEQLRKSGLKPDGATYGLAMEVMLQSGKYDLVHEYFRKMKKSGVASKALTYKVLVRAFWEEGKVDEAVEAVRGMEQRGVVGVASVYYELACCLCNNGRWQDALVEVSVCVRGLLDLCISQKLDFLASLLLGSYSDFLLCFDRPESSFFVEKCMQVDKMKKLSLTKPLEFTFTGMIMSSMDGGHIADCISIFEHMKDHCAPNIGTINSMLKVYGRSDMFSKAKELFEDVKRAKSDSCTSLNGVETALIPDKYTYSSMLVASASALQWEYFEYVYREMTFSGYQLDLSKHASLLVEASSAGKWYLLEHAFETILEAGEVPPPLFFNEMIVQATAQHNYEKAATLVNTMAYAPFQVSEGQWTDLFEKNRHRISEGSLVKLLDTLGNCEVASEATFLNLLRSLHSLCGSATSRDFSSSIALSHEASEKSSLDGSNGGIDKNTGANIPNYSVRMMHENLNPGEDPLVKDSDCTLDTLPVNHTSTNKEVDADSETLTLSPDQDCGTDGETSLCIRGDGFADEVATGTEQLANKLATYLLNENSDDIDELELDTLTIGDDSHESNMPTAREILEAWKESRKKDGILFPFQLGQK
ncbi:pentatricopeptide repeat-containing protein, partial [Quercus suber]